MAEFAGALLALIGLGITAAGVLLLRPPDRR